MKACAASSTEPGELGFGRACVAGDMDVEGDLFFGVAALSVRIPKLGQSQLAQVARLVGLTVFRPLPPSPERRRACTGAGTRSSATRPAIAHHYDAWNTFYRLVLGPSMTYPCAVWPSADATLEEAQAAKYELICRKLDLREARACSTSAAAGAAWR